MPEVCISFITKKARLYLEYTISQHKNIFLLISLFEMLILNKYVFDWNQEFFNLNNIFLHYTKMPIFLILILLFWIYVWAISIWRRTLFGRFTRGDRDLWAKALTSFWFAEFTTFFGFYIAFCWCSWGPMPLFPRMLYFSKKTFYIELTFFTYIVWLVYFLKLSMNTHLWKSQLVISILILLISGYLFWRNFIGLFTREVTGLNSNILWRYTHRLAVLYSLDKNFWFNHQFGDKFDLNTGYNTMQQIIDSNSTIDPFTNVPSKIIHETSSMRGYMSLNDYYIPTTLVFSLKKNNINYYLNLYNLCPVIFEKFSSYWYCSLVSNDTFVGLDFYPQRIGYRTKRYSSWQFLTLLKIWHTLMLLIWWLLFIFKLKAFKKSSFSLIHAAYFNILCCFVMSYFVYYVSTLPYLEGWLKMKVRFWTWSRVPYLNYFMWTYCVDSLLPQWYINLREYSLFSSTLVVDASTKSHDYSNFALKNMQNRLISLILFNKSNI